MYKIFNLEELAGKIKLNLDCSFQIQFTTGLKDTNLNLLAPKQPKTKPSQKKKHKQTKTRQKMDSLSRPSHISPLESLMGV